MNKIFDYTFKNQKLFRQSLCHSSAKSEVLPSNERLEFLGDVVLGLVISEFLYRKFPDKEEGELTIIKSEVVSKPVLTIVAREHDIKHLIKLGKGIKRIPDSILANTLEAILGAIYLDSGLSAVSKIIKNLFSDKIEEVDRRPYEINHKALLQHFTQREYSILPEYKLVKTTGPAHEPLFEVMIKIKDKKYGPGVGKTKKEADQQAANIALKQIKP